MIRVFFFIVFVFLIAGCGGGGGSTSDVDESTSTTASSSSTQELRGYYVDDPIVNVDYSCGKYSGKTDSEGSFIFEDKKDCKLSVANIVLQNIPADKLTDGVVIFENNITIARFLQSIDLKADDDKLEIDSKVVKALESLNVKEIPKDLDSLIDTLNNSLKDDNIELVLKTEEETKEHLASSYEYYKSKVHILTAGNNIIDNSSDINDSKDTTPPSITLKGDNPIKIMWKSDFIDPGVELSDNIDDKDDIKLEVITDLNTSVFTLKDFNITYIATDSAGNQAKAVRVVKLYRTKEQIENLTQKYKVEWYDRAVEVYNSNDPEYPWTDPYISYKFPDDADFEAGNPPDKPITAYEWMENAGVGFTKKISIPSGPYSYDEKLVQEWDKYGLRAGRFHISFHAFLDSNDPNGLKLDKNKLKVLRDACELFTNAGIPVVISTGGDMTPEDLVNDREGTFYKELDWWRQFAEYFKDVSYLLAFENFIECHAFNMELKADWYLRLHIDNNETRFPDFTWKGKTLIDNYVSGIGYNNMNAEIAKVVRVTNPKRIMIYKPGGTGRTGMPYITPWRWGSEPDYLDGDDFYWLISAGGGANMRTSYVYGIREDDPALRDKGIGTAKSYSWGPILDYYQHTQLPIWISLFGIKTEDNTITTEEVVSYVNWYLDSIQTQAYNKKTMKRTRIPSGFQQSWWLWHFGIEEPYWKETTYNDWNVSQIVNALGSHSFGGDLTPKYYPPTFLNDDPLFREGAYVGGEYNSTIFYDAVSDKEDNIKFKKISGPDWLNVLENGELKGVPTVEDVGENNFTVAIIGYKGDMDTKELVINVDRYKHIAFDATDDAMCKLYEADKNFADETSESLRVLSNKYAKVAYFKFNVQTDKTIKGAYFSINASSNGSNLSLYLVKNNLWSEDEITWNNKPEELEKVATFDINSSSAKYINVDISSVVKSSGEYSFRLDTDDNDVKIYFSESSTKPKLIIEEEQ